MPSIEKKLRNLIENMQAELPNPMGIVFFNIREGLILAYKFEFSGADPEAASAVHSKIFKTFDKFLMLMPSEISGELQSITLSVEGAVFFILPDKRKEIAVMVASGSENIGIIRVLSKKYLQQVTKLIYE